MAYEDHRDHGRLRDEDELFGGPSAPRARSPVVWLLPLLAIVIVAGALWALRANAGRATETPRDTAGTSGVTGPAGPGSGSASLHDVVSGSAVGKTIELRDMQVLEVPGTRVFWVSDSGRDRVLVLQPIGGTRVNSGDRVAVSGVIRGASDAASQAQWLSAFERRAFRQVDRGYIDASQVEKK